MNTLSVSWSEDRAISLSKCLLHTTNAYPSLSAISISSTPTVQEVKVPPIAISFPRSCNPTISNGPIYLPAEEEEALSSAFPVCFFAGRLLPVKMGGGRYDVLPPDFPTFCLS